MRATTGGTLRGTTAREVMRMQMVTVVPEMTVRELGQTLLESGVRAAPVLDPAGKILGVASQSDVTRATLQTDHHSNGHSSGNGNGTHAGNGVPCGCSVDTLRVSDVMGPVGDTISPDEPVRRLVSRFVRDRVQRALVVENGMLLGIVTPIDVLGAIDETTP